jgi:topoisomerase-4 subunit A
LSVNDFPRLEIKFGGKHKKREPEVIDAADFIAEKSYKAKGKRLTTFEIASISELEPHRFKDDIPALPEPPVLPDKETADDKPAPPESGLNGEQMSLF